MMLHNASRISFGFLFFVFLPLAQPGSIPDHSKRGGHNHLHVNDNIMK